MGAILHAASPRRALSCVSGSTDRLGRAVLGVDVFSATAARMSALQRRCIDRVALMEIDGTPALPPSLPALASVALGRFRAATRAYGIQCSTTSAKYSRERGMTPE